MNTTILNVSGDSADDVKIEAAGNLLKEGKLVAFPTETVYGLGANALDEEAAARIYSAKGRPSDNPLIVHIADWDALGLIVKEIPPEAKLLADKFWPGPLTMIFKKSDRVPYGTTGGLETVARAHAQPSGGHEAHPGRRRLHCSAQCQHVRAS